MRRLIEVNNICYYVFMFCAYKFYMGSFLKGKNIKIKGLTNVFLYFYISYFLFCLT